MLSNIPEDIIFHIYSRFDLKLFDVINLKNINKYLNQFFILKQKEILTTLLYCRGIHVIETNKSLNFKSIKYTCSIDRTEYTDLLRAVIKFKKIL